MLMIRRVLCSLEKFARNPQSEVLAKYLQDIAKRRGDILTNFSRRFWRLFFADFRPSISRENGSKNISRKLLDIFHSAPNKVLSLVHLWELGGGPREVGH